MVTDLSWKEKKIKQNKAHVWSVTLVILYIQIKYLLEKSCVF